MQAPFSNDRLLLNITRRTTGIVKIEVVRLLAYLYNHIIVMKNNPVGVVLTISYFLGIADFFFYL